MDQLPPNPARQQPQPADRCPGQPAAMVDQRDGHIREVLGLADRTDLTAKELALCGWFAVGAILQHCPPGSPSHALWSD